MIRIRRGVDLKVSVTPGRSPALVFLHGGLGNRFNWRSPMTSEVMAPPPRTSAIRSTAMAAT